MQVESIDVGPAGQGKLVLWKDRRDGLVALDLGGWESRHRSVLHLLERADAEPGLPPFGPLLLHTEDQPVCTREHVWRSYAFCTSASHLDVAAPDFVFGGWPQVGIDDFDETCRSMAVAGAAPAEHQRVGWIGSLDTHPVRVDLHRLGAEHPDLLDVQRITWGARNTDGARLTTLVGRPLTLAEQVARWSALVDVEGAGYSGRLKLLLHSGRPVLVQDRPWHEWWHDELRPMVDHIPVRRDLSDLVERARWVQDHPEEAAAIGAAGQALARRLLTRASAAERWAAIAAAHDRSSGPWAPPELLAALVPRLGRARTVG